MLTLERPGVQLYVYSLDTPYEGNVPGMICSRCYCCSMMIYGAKYPSGTRYLVPYFYEQLRIVQAKHPAHAESSISSFFPGTRMSSLRLRLLIIVMSASQLDNATNEAGSPCVLLKCVFAVLLSSLLYRYARYVLVLTAAQQ